jgi:hypothetical protein
MIDTTYNGWANYATWRVNLEIFDGLEKEEMFDLTLDAWDLGQVLQDYAEDVVTMSIQDPNAPSLALDYAMAFLSDVNWYEIAKHMIADFVLENQE